jgi:hypothetical protein
MLHCYCCLHPLLQNIGNAVLFLADGNGDFTKVGCAAT